MFEGRGPVSIFCKAGDIYLQNNQCWHRGGPHRAERTRYLMQTQYAMQWAHTRFGEYNRVPVPDSVVARSSERVRKIRVFRRICGLISVVGQGAPWKLADLWNPCGIPQVLGNRCAIPTAPTGPTGGEDLVPGLRSGTAGRDPEA